MAPFMVSLRGLDHFQMRFAREAMIRRESAIGEQETAKPICPTDGLSERAIGDSIDKSEMIR